MTNSFNPKILNEAGLNLQSIFDIECLPDEMLATLKNTVADLSEYNQLIIIGHGGTTLWNSVIESEINSADPIDKFSINTVTSFFENELKDKNFKFLYPGKTVIPLQSLGALAGWHHPSLFRIGINKKWGSWFAYRAVVLTASSYEPTAKVREASPCESCVSKECITSCPAGAVSKNVYEYRKCFNYRVQPKSQCKDRCLARISCPVATEHRYTQAQIKYHYGRSLNTLKNM